MNKITEKFGNRIRIRVCGLIYDENKILLMKHSGLNNENEFWAPPGGGLELGESLNDALKREMKEECGVNVLASEYRFINEFISPPLHAIEMFFRITDYDGKVNLGADPEMGDDQIIESLRFVTFKELRIMKDSKKHNILHNHQSSEELNNLKGHIKYISTR